MQITYYLIPLVEGNELEGLDNETVAQVIRLYACVW